MLLWMGSFYLLPCRICRPSTAWGNNRVIDVLGFCPFFFGGHFGWKSRITWRYFSIPNMGSLKRFLSQRWLPFIEIQVFCNFRCVLGLNFLATGLLPLPSWFEGLRITLDLLCLGDGWWYRFIWHGFPVPGITVQTASHFVIQQLWKGKIEWTEHAIPPYWAASLWGKSFLQVCGWLALLLGVFGVFHGGLLSLDSQLTYQS